MSIQLVILNLALAIEIDWSASSNNLGAFFEFTWIKHSSAGFVDSIWRIHIIGGLWIKNWKKIY